MGSVVFHHEKLDTILKITLPGECSMISYEPKQRLLHIFKSPCGRFLTSAHLKIRNNIEKTTTCTRANSSVWINKKVL